MNFVVTLGYNKVKIYGFYSDLHIRAIKHCFCCACVIGELVLSA